MVISLVYFCASRNGSWRSWQSFSNRQCGRIQSLALSKRNASFLKTLRRIHLSLQLYTRSSSASSSQNWRLTFKIWVSRSKTSSWPNLELKNASTRVFSSRFWPWKISCSLRKWWLTGISRWIRTQWSRWRQKGGKRTKYLLPSIKQIMKMMNLRMKKMKQSNCAVSWKSQRSQLK